MLIFLSILSVMVMLMSYWGWYRAHQANQRLHAELRAIRKGMDALFDSAYQVGERVVNLEESMRQLGIRQDHLASVNQMEVPYEHAAKLIELGAERADVQSSSGLQQAEIDLLMSLKQQRKNLKVECL